MIYLNSNSIEEVREGNSTFSNIGMGNEDKRKEVDSSTAIKDQKMVDPKKASDNKVVVLEGFRTSEVSNPIVL